MIVSLHFYRIIYKNSKKYAKLASNSGFAREE